MVFESLVVDVLNRFLGDYVVNLDSSQLSLGIWGGKETPDRLGIAGSALREPPSDPHLRRRLPGSSLVACHWPPGVSVRGGKEV